METQAKKMSYLLANLKNLVDLFNDIYYQLEGEQQTGFEDGTYDEGSTPWLDSARELMDNLEGIEIPEGFRPAIYGYIEGGNFQGASGNCLVSIDIFDKDNYDNDPEHYEEIYDETPESWDNMIKQKTESGEIMPLV